MMDRGIRQKNGRRGYTCDALSRQQPRGAGFTLVEILVALAVFSLMLTIILVPINLSLDLMHIGQARSDVHQASQITLNQIEQELRQAVYVFPNAHVPGVTDRYPYKSGAESAAPYYDMSGVTTITDTFINSASSGACTGIRTSNRARIDFLLPRRVNGVLETPMKPEFYLVTYYARRLYIDQPFHPISNPVVLFRAQIPYKIDDTTYFTAPGFTAALNLNTDSTRYPLNNAPTACGGGNATNINRGAMWLVQSERGEPNLEPLTRTDAGTVVGSHTLATPRGMGLVVPNGLNDSQVPPTPPDYSPTTSFVCEDTTGDGKIDRVQISLELAEFDPAGSDTRNGIPADQRVRFPKTVDLPNVK